MTRQNVGWSMEEAWGRVSTAIAILFATPIGWLLLPVIMFTMAFCAALGVALLPTVLSTIGAAVIQKRRVRYGPVLAVILVALGLLLNFALWNLGYHVWQASSQSV